jgi:hypothetical protein
MLPVLYVPPVTPPSPEDRPPPRRRPRLALVAALLIGTPLLAWATLWLGFAAPEVVALAATPIEATRPADPAATTGTLRLAEAATGPAAGPATSGGSQPYLAGTAPSPKPEPKPAASDPASEGAGVRVIDMNRKAGTEHPAPPKPAPTVATEAPAKPVATETPAKPADVAAPAPVAPSDRKSVV